MFEILAVNFLKRILSILFLFTYLLVATGFNQLLKIPALVGHYYEHNRLDNPVSPGLFLYMHYFGSDMNSSDDQRDMQLPFKSYQSGIAGDFQSVPQHPALFSFASVYFQKVQLRPTTDLVVDSHFFPLVWQPPRAC